MGLIGDILNKGLGLIGQGHPNPGAYTGKVQGPSFGYQAGPMTPSIYGGQTMGQFNSPVGGANTNSDYLGIGQPDQGIPGVEDPAGDPQQKQGILNRIWQEIQAHPGKAIGTAAGAFGAVQDYRDRQHARERQREKERRQDAEYAARDPFRKALANTPIMDEPKTPDLSDVYATTGNPNSRASALYRALNSGR